MGESDFSLISDALQRLVEASGRSWPGPVRSGQEAILRDAVNRYPRLTDGERETATSVARRVLGRTIRVEVGAGDAEFTPTEVAEVLALLRRSQHVPGLSGRVLTVAGERLSRLLREAVHDLPLPDGCTGAWDDFALIVHDGAFCPVHEPVDLDEGE